MTLSTAPSPPVDVRGLWHYTCRDAAPHIDADGSLRPWGHPWFPDPLVWLTDLETPERFALGLGNLAGHVSCDRVQYRYEVLDGAGVIRWSEYARREVRAGRLDRFLRESLESSPGARPAHWYVSLGRVPVRRS